MPPKSADSALFSIRQSNENLRGIGRATDAPAEATSGTDGCLSLWAAPQVSEEGLWLGAKR
jgi:hypothetical protein